MRSFVRSATLALIAFAMLIALAAAAGAEWIGP